MAVISLDKNSKGSKEVICGLDIQLPKRPPKKGILFSEKKKKDQSWKRDETDWSMLSPSNRNKFISKEFERRANGVWFMNNGKPTYITGNHYYYLQWGKIDIGYPDYRDRDRRFFTFWEACKKDPNSYGMIMVKHRREGASWKGACMSLYEITSSYNSHGGLLSKTGQDAKDLFEKVVYMFRGLPDFFQPIIDGSDNPKSRLSFNTPGQKITKNFKKITKSHALNSKIDWRNTRENSYDSAKLKFFMSDEAGKWTEASVDKNWQVVAPCLTLGINVVGKCFMPSTVNELSSGGGDKFKKLWDMSNIEDRDANGRTQSGLYSYFTPAYDGYEGFIDDYGNSMINEAKTFLKNRRDSLKSDTNKLSEEKRQRPFTVEEAFRSDANTSIFDVEKIYQQLDFLESNYDVTTRGNFVWANGIKDTKVIWQPDIKGRWELAWSPDKEMQNSFSKKRNGKYPSNCLELVAGVDPYDHDTTTDGRRSDAASYVFRKFSMKDDFVNAFVCEYVARPPKAEMFYEDMIKQCFYYGCQILVENNKIGVIKYFQTRGYSNYLMDRPESTHTDYSRRQKTPGIPTSGAAVINSMADAIQAYIYDNVGYNEETGDIGNCFFKRLLKDWVSFEIDNRTKYDCTMASGMALLGSQKHIAQKKVKRFIPLIKTYSNKGIISTKI